MPLNDAALDELFKEMSEEDKKKEKVLREQLRAAMAQYEARRPNRRAKRMGGK